MGRIVVEVVQGVRDFDSKGDIRSQISDVRLRTPMPEI